MNREEKRRIRSVFDYVKSELIRHQAIVKDKEKYRQALQDGGWLCKLPLPNGRELFIGKNAHQRLITLAREIIADDERLFGRVRIDPFFEILKKELGRIIWQQEEYKEDFVIETCIKKAIANLCAPREYYIPCIVPAFQGMTQFKIGPVTFIEKESFAASHSERIEAYHSLEFSKFEDFYAVQNWVACIKISGFDKKLAEERAFLCVRLAIASIKSRLEQEPAQWLGTEKQSMPGLTNYALTSEPEGVDPSKINLGWGRRFILNGNNEEVEHLLSAASRSWFIAFGRLIEKIVNLSQWDYLESKIVTAMIWLDIGNSPISSAERVVAFSNCMEALFVTSEGGKKHQLVARSRLFLEYSGWRPNLNGKVDEFYSKRGDIVHGDEMPLNDGLSNTAFVGKYFSDVCIEGFIHFYHWLLSKYHHANTKENERPFNGHRSFNRAMEHELPLFLEQLKSKHSKKCA
ncbi:MULTISPECIES: hypothetical protein [unclassified Pseudovibrio]|uniref:hypothetical protein n=1 Tax=unclassified Pseudovibrio TaxID=2627060 RepID=UPI0007AECB70|nr:MULTISPECIES: hypothetical protein [unclassified Pseudovibrio]KZK97294.1 hypothetical protein PsW74_03734 [Pseudovibrio sp. W74]KZL08980.1 hypothetical protein PsAD14_02559 [Pseudovibrio sp. Ad14]